MGNSGDKKLLPSGGANNDASSNGGAPLRRGWTTGANAAAAALAGLQVFHRGAQALTMGKPQVAIDLPHHTGVVFTGEGVAEKNGRVIAHFKKDAGDDPDITHGIIVSAEVMPIVKNNDDDHDDDHDAPSIELQGGTGVGRVTKLGLPIAVGAPAITKRPSEYIKKNFLNYLHQHPDLPRHWQIIFHLENGVALAKKTLNPRLGIVDGLSILGTSGVVIPYSCAAWIDSIHRSIDVALAYQQNHLLAATGSVSEQAVKEKMKLDDMAIIDMGDFYIAMMKYLKKKNYAGHLTIGGGPGKLLKLAQGHGDLHNGRSKADMGLLANWVGQDMPASDGKDGEKKIALGVIAAASSVAEALANLTNQSAVIATAVRAVILRRCQLVAKKEFPNITINFVMVDRLGNIVAETD